jgi:hypothetical protein
MNDFDPLTPEERNAPFEPGNDLKAKKARTGDSRPFVRSASEAPPPARHPSLGVPVASFL